MELKHNYAVHLDVTKKILSKRGFSFVKELDPESGLFLRWPSPEEWNAASVSIAPIAESDFDKHNLSEILEPLEHILDLTLKNLKIMSIHNVTNLLEKSEHLKCMILNPTQGHLKDTFQFFDRWFCAHLTIFKILHTLEEETHPYRYDVLWQDAIQYLITLRWHLYETRFKSIGVRFSDRSHSNLCIVDHSSGKELTQTVPFESHNARILDIKEKIAHILAEDYIDATGVQPRLRWLLESADIKHTPSRNEATLSPIHRPHLWHVTDNPKEFTLSGMERKLLSSYALESYLFFKGFGGARFANVQENHLGKRINRHIASLYRSLPVPPAKYLDKGSHLFTRWPDERLRWKSHQRKCDASLERFESTPTNSDLDRRLNRAGRAFDVYLTCHRRKAAKSQPLSDTVPLFRSILAEAENLQHSFFRTNHISQLALFQKLFLFVLAVYATGTLTNHSHLNFPRFCKTRLWHFLTDTWCYLANMMSILFTDRKREFHVRSHIQADSIIQLIFDRRYFNWNVASEVANREGTHHSDHFGQFQNLLRGIAGLRAITCTLNKGIMDTVEPVFKLAMGLGWRPPCDMTVWEYFTQSFTPRVIEKMILPAARSVLITSDRTSEVHIDNLSIDMDAFRRIIENPTSFHDPYANKTWLDPDFSMRPSG